MKIFIRLLILVCALNIVFPPWLEWTESRGEIIFEKRFAGYGFARLYQEHVEQKTIAWDGAGTGGKQEAQLHRAVDFHLLSLQSVIIFGCLFTALILSRKQRAQKAWSKDT